MIGKTEEQRMPAVILESKERGTYYPVTAYIADKADIALYRHLKGGEDKNEN